MGIQGTVGSQDHPDIADSPDPLGTVAIQDSVDLLAIRGILDKVDSVGTLDIQDQELAGTRDIRDRVGSLGSQDFLAIPDSPVLRVTVDIQEVV